MFTGNFSLLPLAAADLRQTNLTDAIFISADLRDANLSEAKLHRTDFGFADMQGASLLEANLEGAVLDNARLLGVDLREALLDRTTTLNDVKLGKEREASIRVADVAWGDANLAVIDWSQVKRLQDEFPWWKGDSDALRAIGEAAALRAYRQLATALRNQDLYDEANRFAHRAQVLRCQGLWRGVFRGHLKRVGPALGWTFLWGLAGFGYRPWRPLFWWALVIAVGTFAFYGVDSGWGWTRFFHPLTWNEGFARHRVWTSLIESVNACRGLFYLAQGHQTYTFAQGAIAAVLAVCGLVIEATFIATFTQRFFGR